MATYRNGAAFTADYGNTANLYIQPGYRKLNKAIEQAMLAQFDDSYIPLSLDEEDTLMHCGFLECHHDLLRHNFDG